MLYCPICKNSLTKLDEGYSCSRCVRSFHVVDGIPSFIDQCSKRDGFDAEAFKFLFEMELKHFWHIGRKEIILDIIKRNIDNHENLYMLEIGCGNGSVLSFLKQNKLNIEGGDIFLEGLTFLRQRESSVPLYQIDVLSLPFCNNYDMIGVFDVLEHIDEDEKALSEINQALVPGGNLLITVPANMFLWSYWDIMSYHKRRYSKRELLSKLNRQGFYVKKISYFLCFLFPLFIIVRLIGNIFRAKKEISSEDRFFETKSIPLLNGIFLSILRIEKWLMRYIDLPFGTSLIILAGKK